MTDNKDWTPERCDFVGSIAGVRCSEFAQHDGGHFCIPDPRHDATWDLLATSRKELASIRSLLFLGEEDSIEERIIEIVNEINIVRSELLKADCNMLYPAVNLSDVIKLYEESSKIPHDNLFELYVTEED